MRKKIFLQTEPLHKCYIENITKKDNQTLLVTPPSFRVDLEREIDLVEEILLEPRWDEEEFGL